MTHELTGSHLINGRWVKSAGATFAGINPATGDGLEPQIAEAGETEVNAALAAAAEAFKSAADLPPRWPRDLLDAIAAKIMDLGDALLELTAAETALPQQRLIGERARTTGQLKMFAQIAAEGSWVEAVIDTADPARTPAPKPDLRRMLRPRGPAVVFGASNFPFAFGTLGGDTASALAAGCPVIVKGHPAHPGTSEMLAAAVLAALEETKLPRGLFALLQGRGHELSGALVKHPSTAAVGFTGSLKAGRALFNIAAARPSPIPVFAEMGSINPVVLMPGAIAERGAAIAEGLTASVLMGGGQFCTKPGVVFAVTDKFTGFVQRLAGIIRHAKPVTMLNPALRDHFHKHLQLLDRLEDVNGVDVSEETVGAAGVWPALLQTDAEGFQREPLLREEAFGPATIVVHCNDADEVIACLDQLQGNLTGTIHIGSTDTADAPRVLRSLEEKVGRVIVNGYPTGVEVNNAIVHGGPYPATTDSGTTSVGSAAIRRFVRMVAYQDLPDQLLPPALQNANPLGIQRVVNGRRTDEPIAV
jgi:NADP-dependent aldehyde dehydrogenase